MTDFSCGSVACALGHGPNAGIPRDILLDPEGYTAPEDWWAYGKRCFYDTEREYYWMFSSMWGENDPENTTPKAAARRIRIFLENGVPEDSDSRWGR